MSFSANKGFVSEINVTPFVDVMLVLLIIFMVTAPMMTEGLEVDLPQTSAVENLSTDSENVVLIIRKDGSLSLGGFNTDRNNLSFALESTVKATNKQLFIQADTDVSYGVVVDIMGRIKAAGINNMNVLADRLDEVPAGTPAR